MKKVKGKILGVIGVLAVFGIYYYAALPAFNIHSMEFWILLIVLLVLAAGIYGKIAKVKPDKIRKSKGMRIFLSLILIVIGIWAVGALLSSPIVNAGKYQKLMAVENGEFSKDIEELSFDQIPLLDKDSAEILGNRKMGSMVDMVSQFEVDELYSQINYQDRPVRVSPLKYADLIKWFTNRKEGIPAYIKIDMATQNTELVKLKEGMKYTTSDHFNRNIYRHLRFAYPTYIFNELSFEVDEEGVPYWICPVRKYNIGLFGGATPPPSQTRTFRRALFAVIKRSWNGDGSTDKMQSVSVPLMALIASWICSSFSEITICPVMRIPRLCRDRTVSTFPRFSSLSASRNIFL